MFTFICFVIGIFTLPSLSNGHLSLLKTDDPVAIFQELGETIDYQRNLINSLPENSPLKEDFLTDLLKSKLLSGNYVDGDNVSACAISMKDLIFDIAQRKSYSLRMIDAWGKLGSGIATGNTKRIGRYYECLDVKATNFSGQYFYTVIGSNPTYGFAFGICLPDTCSEEDANEMIRPFSELIKTEVHAYLVAQPTKYLTIDIAALSVSCVLGFLLVVATFYELYLNYWQTKDYDPLTSLNTEGDVVTSVQPSVASQLLLSFSVMKSTRALLDTTQKDGNINVLHGLRFISMTWVIIGHTFAFGAPFVDNILDGATFYLSDWKFQAIGNGTYSVDSFFFLSGLLATYLGMREMKKRNGSLSIGLPYLYRYLRLTPAYAFCILISMSIYSKMGDGPLWPSNALGVKTPCEKYWWTNLIYINNLYPTSLLDECFAWGWYLANDMQFFLLSPFILWALFKSPLLGSVILSVGTGLSIMVTGILSSHYHEQPTAVSLGIIFYNTTHPVNQGNETAAITGYADSNVTTPSPPNPGPSSVDKFWSDIYTKPWCRIGVYFLGMATGYILYRKRLKIRLGKLAAALGWILWSATALAIIYGLYGHLNSRTGLSNGVAAFYNAVSRPLWGACLAWVVVACSSGYGGPINRFLSWKVFIPLSRLTYCAYLVHPLVLSWANGILEELLHFSVAEITLRFLAFLTLSYAVAFLVSVLVEMPVLAIIRFTLGRTMGKSALFRVREEQERPVTPDEGDQTEAPKSVP